jgi:hypothetical protein
MSRNRPLLAQQRGNIPHLAGQHGQFARRIAACQRASSQAGGRHVDLEFARNYKNMTLDRIDFESKRD